MVADAAGDDLLRPKTSKNHQDCSDLLRLAMKNPFEQGYAKPTALKFCVFACRHHAMADIPKMPIDEDSEIEAACLTRAKVAAPCREGCRSNFHRTKIGVAREFRSIRGRTECYAKGPIVRMAWARMFDSFANLGCGGPVQFN